MSWPNTMMDITSQPHPWTSGHMLLPVENLEGAVPCSLRSQYSPCWRDLHQIQLVFFWLQNLPAANHLLLAARGTPSEAA